MAADPRQQPLAFHCVVYGQPAPQGSKKHVGGGKVVESSKAVEPWREAVKQAARRVIEAWDRSFHADHDLAQKPITRPEQRPFSAMEGPLGIEVVFTVRKPASAPKRRQTWPAKKPDIDKLQRAVFDALTDAGAWVDDGQVVDARARKVFPLEDPEALGSPGCVIHIWRVTDGG